MRVDRWQDQFWKHVEAAQTKHFEWGVHDCAVFAIGDIKAVTDDAELVSRIAAQFGSWNDAASAVHAYGNDLDAAVRRILGEPVRWQQLQQADLCLIVDENERQVIAVHDGAELIAPAALGLQVIPWKYAQHGWRIG